jgi:hypothetical protein
LIDAFTGFIDAIRNIPTFIEENRTALSLLSGVVTVYVASMAAANIETSLLLLKQKLLSGEFGITAIRQRLVTAAQKADTVAKRVGAVATEGATIAVQGFNAALRANPIGLVIGALTTLYLLFADFGDEVETTAGELDGFVSASKSINEFSKETSKNLAKETGELNALFTILKKTKTGTEERQKTINEINSKYGVTLKNLTDEKKFVGQLDQAYKDILVTLKQTVLVESRKNQLSKLYDEQTTATDDLKAAELARKNGLIELQKEEEKAAKRAKALSTAEAGNTRLSGLRVDLQKTTKNSDDAKKAFDANVEAQKTKLAEINKAIEGVEQQYVDASKAFSKTTKDAGDPVDPETIKATAKLIGDLSKELADLKAETEIQPIELIDPENVEQSIGQLEKLKEAQKAQIDASIEARRKEAREAKTLTATTGQQLTDIGTEKKLGVEIAFQNKVNAIRKEAAEKDADTVFQIEQTATERKLFEQESANQRLEDMAAEMADRLANATTEKAREGIRAEFRAKIEEIKAGYKLEEAIRIKQIEQARDNDLKNTNLTENERKLIVQTADLEILKVKKDFSDKSVEVNKNANDTTKKDDKETQQEIIEGIKEVTSQTIGLINSITAARIAETEQAISVQERRIERASQIAEKGNAEILQIEEERLDKLNEQRAKFVRQQQALALIELVVNSTVAISKAARDGGAAAPFTIASTLIALAAGFVAAKAQAQAAGGFRHGGFTGEGGTYEPAGVVHKREFVFSQEKTAKFRPLFEAIHKGRDPFIATGMGEKIVIINNSGMDEKLTRIEKAIKSQKGLELSISEKGIHGLVSNIQWKDSRIRNKSK